jgi:hypothetical protein
MSPGQHGKAKPGGSSSDGADLRIDLVDHADDRRDKSKRSGKLRRDERQEWNALDALDERDRLLQDRPVLTEFAAQLSGNILPVDGSKTELRDMILICGCSLRPWSSSTAFLICGNEDAYAAWKDSARFSRCGICDSFLFSIHQDRSALFTLLTDKLQPFTNSLILMRPADLQIHLHGVHGSDDIGDEIQGNGDPLWIFEPAVKCHPTQLRDSS